MTAAPIDDARTMWELVARRAEATPDVLMLVDADDRSLTFGGFRDRAERVAAGLQELGIGAGDPVSWQLPSRIETVVLSMALARLGAVQNPIIHIYREREVGYALRETRAKLVATPGEWGGFDYRGMVEKLSADLDVPPVVLTAYDELPEGDPATLPPVVAPAEGDDPVRWIYYTSGTTANPKGVVHTDATLIAGGTGMAEAFGMTPDDVGSIAFPFAHIGGPDYLVTMLRHGFGAVLLERFVPAQAVEVFNRHGVTMAGGSTAFYTAFLGLQRQQPGTPIVPTLRMLSGGGAPKPPEIYFEVQREMGIPIAHGYGMTECPMICSGSPWDTDDQLAYSEGKPVVGCEVRITLPDGSEAPVGVDGEVHLRGTMLAKGYTDPVLTAEAFVDGWFHTGDLGHLRPDGHVTLTGRLKDVIIRKGENVSAKEVEDVLYTHPKVADVAVIGLPDPDRGERVCAVVETAPDEEPLTFAEMVEHCRQAGLMTQKIPEQLEVVDVLPRNATLKVLKHVLRDRYRDQPWTPG